MTFRSLIMYGEATYVLHRPHIFECMHETMRTYISTTVEAIFQNPAQPIIILHLVPLNTFVAYKGRLACFHRYKTRKTNDSKFGKNAKIKVKIWVVEPLPFHSKNIYTITSASEHRPNALLKQIQVSHSSSALCECFLARRGNPSGNKNHDSNT